MRQRKNYSTEFKSEAVKLLLIYGNSPGEVADQLGVPVRLLYTWKRKLLDTLEQQSGDLAGDEQSPKAMAAELSQLRKELAKQKRMNEILKKTVGYFSNPD